MPTNRQDKFRIEAKTRLLIRGLTVTSLAQLIGFSRNAVSMAINHEVHPTVQRRIAQELGVEAPQ